MGHCHKCYVKNQRFRPGWGSLESNTVAADVRNPGDCFDLNKM